MNWAVTVQLDPGVIVLMQLSAGSVNCAALAPVTLTEEVTRFADPVLVIVTDGQVFELPTATLPHGIVPVFGLKIGAGAADP